MLFRIHRDLAITNNPLFEEPILAWAHGPVVEEIFREYERYQSDPIKFDEDFDFSQIDSKTQHILEKVFDTFGQYAAWKLREMTQQEKPWTNTDRNEKIRKKDIKKFFASRKKTGKSTRNGMDCF